MAAATMAGCNYLDIVPDNTVELSNLFETKEKAYNALADCYSYMPDIEGVHLSMALAGDEWIGRLDAGVAGVRSYTRGSKLMRDWNNSTDPILGFWSGAGGAKDLYEGIRICNIFLNGLGDIPNMQEEERIDWMSQVSTITSICFVSTARSSSPTRTTSPMTTLTTSVRSVSPLRSASSISSAL